LTKELYQMVRSGLLVFVACSLLGGSSARAQEVSCRDALRACQQWCYSQRGGPEMFLCKSNCQAEFVSSLGTGVFRREDGQSVQCQSVPNVVWRDGRRETGLSGREGERLIEHVDNRT